MLQNGYHAVVMGEQKPRSKKKGEDGVSRGLLGPTPLCTLFDSDRILPHTILRGGDAPCSLLRETLPENAKRNASPQRFIGRGHAGTSSYWSGIQP